MRLKPTHKNIVGLIAWLIICYAASALGALATFKAQAIYGQLIQPSWAPPGWLFGPVWTTLYTMMAIAAWLIWRQGGCKENRLALGCFLVQLVLNALWSWLFFAWMQGFGSFVNIIVLWVAILVTVILFWRSNRTAGALLIPYNMWVSFAAVLNYAMWQLNPLLLG